VDRYPRQAEGGGDEAEQVPNRCLFCWHRIQPFTVLVRGERSTLR
jgi:hypothetical protein